MNMNKTLRFFLTVVAMFGMAGVVQAQQYYWSNFIGKPGSSGTANGTGSAARFSAPYSTAVDGGGNVYVADSGNHTIRKIAASGTTWVVTILAGTPGVSGTADGTGTSAQFNIPTGVAVDSGSNVYVADSGNDTIRKITPAGVVTTLAGSPGQSGFSDDTGSAALFGCPTGVAVDGNGTVYVADASNSVIRKITVSGVVTTLAGIPGQPGYADGLTGVALFNTPNQVAVDASGNVYVADTLNHVIRKVSSGGTVTTLAGTPTLVGAFDGNGSGAMFNYPVSVAVDASGNAYVADSCNHAIRKITSAGMVITLSGSVANRTNLNAGSYGVAGFKDGTSSVAMFNYPRGVAVDPSGNIFVADGSNNAIRKLTNTGYTTTIAGAPNQSGITNGTGSAATFNCPNGVTVDSGSNIYVADTSNHLIRKATSAAVVTTLAGKGSVGSGDGTGTAATFDYPYSTAADSSGHIYVADTFNHTIRQITTSSGVVVTVSGSAGGAGSVDGAGNVARFNNPSGIAADASGNIYVADTYNHTLRMITVSGTVGTVTTLCGNAGVSGTGDGVGNAALLNYPTGVAVDSSMNIYVADSGNYTIRKITLSGTNRVSTTLAGTPGVSGSADGIGTAAQFGCPTGIAVDSSSNVYVADSGNSTIRKITPAGVVTTIGGTPGVIGGVDGIGNAGLFANPYSLAVDSLGNVFVADSGNNRVSVGSCVGTGSVTGIAGTTGTLSGQACPNGVATTVYFRYGTTTAYSTGTTGSQSIGSGTNFVSVTAALSGLTASTTYHYQLVLVNANGTFYGTDQVFTTPPTAIPNISSAATATGTNGLAFSYQISASNSPTGFGATPLPAGLTFEPMTGFLSGTPTVTATTSVQLSATNVVGTGTKTLTLSIVNMPLPNVTSSTTAQGVAGSSFTYYITAGNYPTGYWAPTLPSGLTLNSTTGVISGTLAQSGTITSTIGAINVSGTGTATLTISVLPAYYWGNFAGSPRVTGSADGTGSAARFNYPRSLAMDSGSNIYVADTSNHTIRKTTPAGVTTTLAGTPGVTGSLDGTGSAVGFNSPEGIAVDPSGNLYVADCYNCTIRMVTPSGVVTTLAGSPGVSGTANGAGSIARFNYPQGIAVDSGSNVYVADASNCSIRKLTLSGSTWSVSTFAGTSGSSGSTDATGTAARFGYPQGIAVDSGSNVYVADTNNCTIRKVTPAGVVTTLAGSAGRSAITDGIGSSAQFSYPCGIDVDAIGNIYVADTSSQTIRKMMLSGSNWMVTTIGGTPAITGTSDGLGPKARFYYPNDMAVDGSGNVFVIDLYNSRVSKGTPLLPPVITSATAVTLASGSAFSYQIAASNSPTGYGALGLPAGLTVDSGSGLISGTSSVSGTFPVVLSASNPAGSGTATLTLTISSSYTSWQSQQFTPAELLDPTVSGPTAMPSCDGIANLIKYALGLSPKVNYSGSAALPYAQRQAVSGTTYLTLTFTRNAQATDVTYSVEATSDLTATWTSIDPLNAANQTSVLSDTPSPGIQTITVKDAQPASSSPRRFMRLRVTVP